MIIRFRARQEVKLERNEPGVTSGRKRLLGTVYDREVKRNISIWTIPEHEPSFFYYQSKLAVDADGSPHAYHPQDKGLDDLKNAGRPGNWWGIVTHNQKPWGTPVIQKAGDPAPGYYVSQTAWHDPSKSPKDPSAYVNAEEIPYIVLPYERSFNAKLGDLAVVYNLANDRWSYAVYADNYELKYGDLGIGEGSIALAERLGLNPDPRSGGTGGKPHIVYIVFPGSGEWGGKLPPVSEIEARGAQVFHQWGGMSYLEEIKRTLSSAS